MDAADLKIIQEYISIQSFLADWHVRVTWIGFLTLWVLWGASWFIRNAFGGDHGDHVIQSSGQIAAENQATGYNNTTAAGTTGYNNTTTDGAGTTGYNNTTTSGVGTDPETGVQSNVPAGTATTKKHTKYLAAPAWSVNVFNRLNRAHDMLRDLILLLLSVLTLNTFARGSTRAVMIITWIFVAFAFIYFFVEASYEHRYLRLLYSTTFYALGLAIAGLAFYYGFS